MRPSLLRFVRILPCLLESLCKSFTLLCINTDSSNPLSGFIAAPCFLLLLFAATARSRDLFGFPAVRN